MLPLRGGWGCLMSYMVNSELLLLLQQEDALVDGSDGAQRARLSPQTQRRLLGWKRLDGRELQGHLDRADRGRRVSR